jgi:ribosome-associated protein
MRKVSNITDFFIICSGTSSRQLKAISDNILEELHQRGCKPWHVEGYQDALWVLVDFGDVVVHLFHTSARDFYELERLWNDAPRIKIHEKTSISD